MMRIIQLQKILYRFILLILNFKSYPIRQMQENPKFGLSDSLFFQHVSVVVELPFVVSRIVVETHGRASLRSSFPRSSAPRISSIVSKLLLSSRISKFFPITQLGLQVLMSIVSSAANGNDARRTSPQIKTICRIFLRKPLSIAITALAMERGAFTICFALTDESG
jgi:hypothetical protein